LAGDHCQLPPTVLSREAAQEGFGVSLLERLMQLTGGSLARQLTTQYRMHAQIMDFPSREFYQTSLAADASVREHLLKDLPGVETSDQTTAPLEFIDTAGAGFSEEQEADGASRLNRQEAELIVTHARRLLAAGLEPRQVAVITPYAAQARLIRELLQIPGLEVDTVDGFQGREKEAILITLVRSNDEGEIGFLADTRRMNVALTRARRKLTVVGDGATIANHPFYQRLLAFAEEQGVYRTVWESGEWRVES
jgi:predicted DNA helicase